DRKSVMNYFVPTSVVIVSAEVFAKKKRFLGYLVLGYPGCVIAVEDAAKETLPPFFKRFNPTKAMEFIKENWTRTVEVRNHAERFEEIVSWLEGGE
ncbi:MAG: hypothetical protein K8S56_01815, partial [Candidatus Cloacimonetes bacterium]|nr:hypothetical protein [Candidatus Cloacimonadota bacterium]